MEEVFHGQSTKQNYKSDIEDSLKQKTVYKNYEYFDDYSYGNSESIGFLLTNIKDKPNLILFQSDGPKTIEIMRKLLEWRKSGYSKEIGHKGGGNKRNIYGFKSDKTHIFNNLGNSSILKSETCPNKIFNLSNSNISEDEFRNRIDTSEFVIIPEIIDEDELPNWYNKLIQNICNSCSIKTNYIIRMELTEVPDEYTNKLLWNEFINQIRAKQYEIPIYFKNELIDMEIFETYNNIDLVGFKNKENEKTIELFININDYSKFYLKLDNKIIDVNTGNEIFNNNYIIWGKINMFVVNELYFNEQLKLYNNNLEDTLRAEDAYGVYLILNNKLTNYKPIEGNPLPPGKNNGIKTETSKNTNRFRMIFIPNNETCSNQNIFNALIRTETIKSLSGFLDKSQYKKIIKRSMDFYKGNKTKINSSPKIKINRDDNPIGKVYILYLGCNLYKFGRVTNTKLYNKRKISHKNNSIEMVKKFTNKDMSIKQVIEIFTLDTSSPKAIEEKICKILSEDISNKIKMFQSESANNESREYFMCESLDHITQNIIPLIN